MSFKCSDVLLQLQVHSKTYKSLTVDFLNCSVSPVVEVFKTLLHHLCTDLSNIIVTLCLLWLQQNFCSKISPCQDVFLLFLSGLYFSKGLYGEVVAWAGVQRYLEPAWSFYWCYPKSIWLLLLYCVVILTIDLSMNYLLAVKLQAAATDISLYKDHLFSPEEG